MYARVTDDIVEGAVEASGAGGGALGSDDWRAACVNELTDLDNFDPISGFPAYKALLCEVERAGAGGRQTVGTGEYETGGASGPAAQAARADIPRPQCDDPDGRLRERSDGRGPGALRQCIGHLFSGQGGARGNRAGAQKPFPFSRAARPEDSFLRAAVPRPIISSSRALPSRQPLQKTTLSHQRSSTPPCWPPAASLKRSASK